MGTQSLVIAASMGGTGIAQGFERRRGGRTETGGPGDQEASMVKMGLLQDGKSMNLVAASREFSISIDRTNLLDHSLQSFEMLRFDDDIHVEDIEVR